MKRIFSVWLLVGFFAAFFPFLDVQAASNGQWAVEWDASVQKNWAKWSKNESQVSFQQLVDCLSDSSYAGADAVTLATLTNYLRSKGFSMQEASPKHQFPERTTLVITQAEALQLSFVPQVKSRYLSYDKALKNTNRQLFPDGQPSFSANLGQGGAGDCFFFSAMGWLAKNRPQEIAHAITAESESHYRVRFPGGQSIAVNAPTDAELIFFNSPATLTTGLWMPVLEKAVGAVYPEYNNSKSRGDYRDPIENLDEGGSASVVEKIWTGRQSISICLHSRNAGKIASYDRNNKLQYLSVGGLKDVLRQSAKHITQATAVNKPTNPSIHNHHVYAVFAYDEENGAVTLWNPWGDANKSLGSLFTLPFDEFLVNYQWIFIN